MATKALDIKLQTNYDNPFGSPTYSVTVGGKVPTGKSVILQKMGHNIVQPSGDDEIMLIDGGTLHLDNMQMRSIIFRNATITYTYNGGPLVLNRIIFVKCTFVLANTPGGRAFAASLNWAVC